MKITRIEKFSEKELIEKLKNVTMLKAPQTKVYTNTLISLEKLRPEFLAPPQNYILKQELKKVRELKWTLEKHDINIFELKGFLRIFFDSVEEPVDLLPQ